MSSDEADQKNVEENTKDNVENTDEDSDSKEEKVNSKPSPKKKGTDQPKIKQPAKKRVKTEQTEKESKKEDKKDAKAKEEAKEEREGEAEENGVDDPVPLLDQPLEISGSRKRKEVQRFVPVTPDEETKEISIPGGKGKLLGNIESIAFNIQRAKPEDLKLLHRLCFNKPGKAALLKNNLKKFKGFEFEEASDDYEKKKTHAEQSFKKVTVAHLKNICNILDIEKGGHKNEILDRILSFLVCPVDSGKKIGSGRTKRKGASAKNYDEGDETFDEKPLSKKKKFKKMSENEESESDKEEKSDEESADEKKEEVKSNKKNNATTEESEADDEEEEEKAKPKKGAKKGKKVTENVDKKAPPKKRAAAKKAAEKKVESEEDGDKDDSDEDEPLVKKGKNPPTDEEIKNYVKTLLDGANLELITMKKVCQDVYEHYPDFDLGHKKDFIKTTVKSLISS